MCLYKIRAQKVTLGFFFFFLLMYFCYSCVKADRIDLLQLFVIIPAFQERLSLKHITTECRPPSRLVIALLAGIM